VRVSAAQADGSTSITVADSGLGIAAEHHERVFDHFWQVDGSPARAAPGTGLGLAICRRLADLLGGKIRLESELGRGAAFTLVLPASAS
jgi:signal transduction histidine kinase